MNRLWLVIPLLFLVAACNENSGSTNKTGDEQKGTDNVVTTTTEVDAENKPDLEVEKTDFEGKEEILAAIEKMYDWQSYRANYHYAYMLEDAELYSLMKFDYVADPMQKYALITTPYMDEEYYAIENKGVFNYDYNEERWLFDDNTDLALENEISYSYRLLQLIAENIRENTTTQDIDGPLIANIILQEGNLFETFRYFLSSRYEPIQEILFANVVDVPAGSALIFFENDQIVRYELRLDVVLEDGKETVLEIKEQFDDVNEFSEIVVPDAVYAG